MDAKEFIHKTVSEHPVVLFMKGTAQFPQCGFSGRAIQVLKQAGASSLVTVNVLEDDDVRQGVKEYANWPTDDGAPADRRHHRRQRSDLRRAAAAPPARAR
jgi:monothiol glutaredoxin